MATQLGPPTYTPQELEAFNYYFNLWGNGQVFPAQQAAQLKASNLPQPALKYIWGACAKTNPIFLTKDEFFLALRMIAMYQNGLDLNNPMSYQMYTRMHFSILLPF